MMEAQDQFVTCHKTVTQATGGPVLNSDMEIGMAIFRGLKMGQGLYSFYCRKNCVLQGHGAEIGR
jgi:hypothetical protein